MLTATWAAVEDWYSGRYRAAAAGFAHLAHVATAGTGPSSDALRIHALCWQAASRTRVGELQPADAVLKEAERLLAQSPWPNCRGWLYAERGRLAFWENAITRSLSEYARAAQAFLEAGNDFGRANISEGRARILIHQGQYTEALLELSKAERYREPEDHLGLVKRLYHSGRVFRYEKRLDDAASLLTRALEIIRTDFDNDRWEAHVRDVLGDVYLLQGKVGLAAREFNQPVFNGDDPVVATRRTYRLGKIELEKARTAPHGNARRRALEAVVRHCEELIEGTALQLLPEKGLRLKGAAHRELDDLVRAAECFEAAARRFSSRQSTWYLSDCLRQAGECRLKAGNVQEAAADFLEALRTAVDDVQRSDALKSLQDEFRELDARDVCSLLAQLTSERTRLREQVDQVQSSFAAFRELIWNIASMPLRGAQCHIGAGIEKMCSGESVQTATREMATYYQDLRRAVALLLEAIRSTAAMPGVWLNCSAGEFVHSLPEFVTHDLPREQTADWRLYCRPEPLREALATVAGFSADRGNSRQGSARVDPDRGLLLIRIEFGGEKLPLECSLFRPYPELSQLQDWQFDVPDWARLQTAVREIQAAGGSVECRRVASRGPAASECVYCLTIELPVTPPPFGAEGTPISADSPP